MRNCLAILPAILLLSSCGDGISDRRVEKLTLPAGGILTNESYVEGYDPFCLRHCEPQRFSKLTVQSAPGRMPEEVAELRTRPESDCCSLESVRPIRLEQFGELQAIVFGSYLFTRWASPHRWPWDRWQTADEEEAAYFLRHFHCEVISRPNGMGPGPCHFSDGNPYREISVDLRTPVARLSRTAPAAGWPRVLVYSAPARLRWQFDFERTVRENPALRYRAFPSGVRVEAVFLQTSRVNSPFYGRPTTPEDFIRDFPAARVLLQRRLPISSTAWTTASGPVGSDRSYELRGAYGDPDAEWVTLYTRFTGWKGHNVHFLRIGEWLALSASNSDETEPTAMAPSSVAAFIRLVR